MITFIGGGIVLVKSSVSSSLVTDPVVAFVPAPLVVVKELNELSNADEPFPLLEFRFAEHSKLD